MEISHEARRKGRKSDLFLAKAQPFAEVLFVTHDNPDPDGLACGWALGELVREKLGKPYRLLARGAVLRAENRHLLKLLSPPLELVDELKIDSNTLAVLIDCRPEAFNHLPLVGANMAVIDHHKAQQRLPPAVVYADLRPKVAASASIAACYLHEQNLIPTPQLATALVYAIRTEAGGGSVHFSPLDQRMFNWASRYAQADFLAEIEEAPLPRVYFNDLAQALQNTEIIHKLAICMLPTVTAPETVGEVADLLIRCEGIEAVLCWGKHETRIMLSSRTRRGSRRDATDLVSRVVQGLGHSGGHEYRAGGMIPLPQARENEARLAPLIRHRWLMACNVNDENATALVGSRPLPALAYFDSGLQA
jgi:nanoRNase/pAp phosphatase (c-di-AMP/oligoRNAs hydrolase)